MEAHRLQSVEEVPVNIRTSVSDSLTVADGIGSKTEEAPGPVQMTLYPQVHKALRAAVVLSNQGIGSG